MIAVNRSSEICHPCWVYENETFSMMFSTKQMGISQVVEFKFCSTIKSHFMDNLLSSSM